MGIINNIFYLLSYPLVTSKNCLINFYNNYIPNIGNIEEFIWSQETAWLITLIGGCSFFLEIYIVYTLYNYSQNINVLEEENCINKSFFYFRVPTETNTSLYVGPVEKDLLIYNCLLTRSLSGRLDQENSKYLDKIPYERITYLYEEAVHQKKLLNTFLGVIDKNERFIKFFKIKEKIINDKFYSFQLHNKNILNKDWFKFKGYYVKASEHWNLLSFEYLNIQHLFYLISFFTITIYILFIFSKKINNNKIK